MADKRTERPIEQFEKWLAKDGMGMGCEQLTETQKTIASTLLSLPCRSGKSWLIDRLYNFDHRRTRIAL